MATLLPLRNRHIRRPEGQYCQNPQALTEVSSGLSGSHQHGGRHPRKAGLAPNPLFYCHNQVPSIASASPPESLDPGHALLVTGGLGNKIPDRIPHVDRLPAMFILSHARTTGRNHAVKASEPQASLAASPSRRG
ncbi:hypothetical protein [Arthrobacter methylotrophus]|uniref:hypothetical protein n=1 Tax=Arthrobacter methylotrophus TaxID=121291 RepID=UPI0031E89579